MAVSVAPPSPTGAPLWRGSDGAGAPVERVTAAAAHLVDLLDAHLAAALGREVSLREAAGGSINLGESVRYARRAEEAEHAGQWADAAVQWHLAALAAPDDSTMVLRAATALRWAGASPRLFDRYTRLVRDQDLLMPPPGTRPHAGPPTPAPVPAVQPEPLPAGPPARPPSRRPPRR